MITNNRRSIRRKCDEHKRSTKVIKALKVIVTEEDLWRWRTRSTSSSSWHKV